MTIRNEWWWPYIWTELGYVSKCFAAEINSNFTEIIFLGLFAAAKGLVPFHSPHDSLEDNGPDRMDHYPTISSS